MERNPKYSRYAVTFFDILGFRSLVNNKDPFGIVRAMEGLILRLLLTEGSAGARARASACQAGVLSTMVL